MAGRGGRRSTTRIGNGPGAGDGWGGPPRGAGSDAEKAPAFEPGNSAAAGPHDMTGAQRARMLKDHLFQLATTAERQETQVRAAEAWLDREEGQPLRKVQMGGELNIRNESDADLESRLADLLGKAGVAGEIAGAGTPRPPQED